MFHFLSAALIPTALAALSSRRRKIGVPSFIGMGWDGVFALFRRVGYWERSFVIDWSDWAGCGLELCPLLSLLLLKTRRLVYTNVVFSCYVHVHCSLLF
jgi:hypothetical protein